MTNQEATPRTAHQVLPGEFERLEPLKGSYRTPDGKAQIDYELKQTSKGYEFSASGEYAGSFGQNIDTIGDAYPGDAMISRIRNVWKSYHLNGMHAGCTHQRAEKWGEKEITVISVSVDTWRIRGEAQRRDAELAIEGKGFSRDYPAELIREAVHAAKQGQVYTPKTEGAKSWFEHDIIKIKTEKTLSGHIYQKDHPEGVLAKPCPICGYKYGTAWLFEPIPENVIEEIKSWNNAPQPSESLSEFQAKNFLATHGLKFRATLSDSKSAPWEPSGHHFRVTISRERSKGSRIVFDFWGSRRDLDIDRRELSPYDVLSSLSREATIPDTFHEFCQEFGYEEDSIKALQSFRRCDRFARRLLAFFTPDEISELQEIN
jgi:hypothetical protein